VSAEVSSMNRTVSLHLLVQTDKAINTADDFESTVNALQARLDNIRLQGHGSRSRRTEGIAPC
jgi:hypothetical protein